MYDLIRTDKQVNASLRRLLPRLEEKFAHKVEEAEWQGFIERIKRHFPGLFRRLHHLYGQQYDFFYYLEMILSTAADMWIKRPDDLKALDAIREADPQWYQSAHMVGAVYYVDLFSNDLEGLKEKIPYLKELGITYLHLMPFFRTPEGDDDGGYAVSSYREVDEKIGTMESVRELAAELRYNGISLVLDFIFNHTADDHEWAKNALAGDEEYQEFYRMFPDRKIPDQYEKTITPVFYDDHPGSFTYRPRIKKWVWTTFHNYQWDLNYENPAVFNAMAEEMLFLANQGVEILRLDAVAFIWKKMGTSCENLPEAHLVIQAFNAVMKIVAPALLFKSEAIVHPDEVTKYISENECQLSYNPQLMALLWNSLATRKVRLLKQALKKRFDLPKNCSWVNYVRLHDDIGWAYSNEDAEELGINARDHRRFLSAFYTGRFSGSFSRGLPFQEDPATGEGRVSGTTASLSGLEKALEENNEKEIEYSIRRIMLLYGVSFTIGGIPLIYLGDEIGMLNDYEYESDMEKIGDTRWIHRPEFDWEKADKRRDPDTVTGRIFMGMLRLIQLRKNNPAFAIGDTDFSDIGNEHILAYFKNSHGYSVFVLANFSEHKQSVAGNKLRLLGLSKTVTDMVSGKTIIAAHNLELEPYQFMVLKGVR